MFKIDTIRLDMILICEGSINQESFGDKISNSNNKLF